jgi:hypothetical protein
LLGPLLIFDKSFLQMLNAEEVSELSMYFTFVGTPLLIREIISDLKKEPTDRRLPEQTVRALASKMWSAHGLQPANFRKLCVASLCCIMDVPMFGQVPVDADAPNVFVTEDGKGVLYDSTLEQEMWQRWESGDFTTDDAQSATAWREGVQSINLRAVGEHWKEFAKEHFGKARNLPELIILVNSMLDDFDRKVQFRLLVMSMSFLDVSIPAARWATMLFEAGLMPRVKDLCPYAASVLRLYLTFIGGLGRGFIGPRPSHYVDLQYLFYAPFCMGFVSSDKFHREMWPATSGENTFIWGPDLKKELQQRVEMNSKMKEQEESKHVFPAFPKELQDAPIHILWQKYIVLPMGDFQPTRPDRITRPAPSKKSSDAKKPKLVEDLDPVDRDRIKSAFRIVDEAKKRRAEAAKAHRSETTAREHKGEE